jgi:hypothetical protein
MLSLLDPRRPAGATGFAIAATLFVLLRLTASPPASQHAIVIPEMKHGGSAPLRTLADKSAGFWPQDGDTEDQPPEGHESEAAAVSLVDPVRQRPVGTALVTIPGMNLPGLGNGFTGPGGSLFFKGVPPDPNSAVGGAQIVETVNLALAVFDKLTGSAIMGPVFIGALWRTFDASCSNASSLADPVVLYDKQAGRWVVKIGTLGTPYVACLAVSETSDATGAYYLYAFQIQAEGRLTGQKLATWPDAYYLATSITNNSVYAGPSACALDRSRMLTGQTATMQCIPIGDTSIQGMVPSNMDGPAAPPAGSPNYFLIGGPRNSNALYLYRFHVDFANPANTNLAGPNRISVAPYTISKDVPQYGTTQLLHSNGFGLLTPVQYRNFAGAAPPYESLVVTHSVLTGTASSRGVGMRWYELRNPGSTPLVYQQGTYAPDSNYRWMGSIAMDGMGDIALGYSVSTTAAYPAVRYTGRVPSDPPGTMETEAAIFDGSGNQSDSDRWGDYTSMSVDPVDDCTMWYTGQYLAATGSENWATRLFSFRFPACRQAAAAADHAGTSGKP